MDSHSKLNLKEAAIYVGVSPITLRREIKLGRIRHYRIGPGKRRIAFSVEQLDEYVNRCEQQAAAA